jgi:hypothetical protein
MAPQKRKDKSMGLLKSLILVITCLSFFGFLSCNNSGTRSTTSSGGGSGTGTNWTITIQIGTNPLPFTGYSTTSVMAIVKDKTGAPAPYGTYVCMTAVYNGFLKSGDTTLYATICESISNNLGQSIQTYKGELLSGDDTVEVSSQGVIATATIHNS